MQTNAIHKLLLLLIAMVWLVNGLFCKLLNLVPRHRQIVARILGDNYAGLITKAIGLAEISLAVWILSGYKSRLCAIIQITTIALMNLIEFYLAPDLLLFGKMNALYALLLILLIGYNAFVLSPKAAHN